MGNVVKRETHENLVLSYRELRASVEALERFNSPLYQIAAERAATALSGASKRILEIRRMLDMGKDIEEEHNG